MPCFPYVIGTFTSLFKAAHASVCMQGREVFGPAGQYFMGIALMADIKKNLVTRCMKDIMSRNRQFDGTEITGKMAACMRNIFYQKLAYVFRQLFQLFYG